ncbi:hypothetical protein [Flavobacterium coralii]|uniref:hypothetical protein n=1 Tax=Flavobacterium coralii TaxID=2838017 RepID=UPI000C41A1C0|nr:hypothetical protein [Flavobacterium sp.]|tara:strand:+ start:43075 stop:43566 length:492 start_codon:yes stop_codon:yes gene_type:complete
MAFRKNNESPVQKLLDFLKKNWKTILGCIVAFPLILWFINYTSRQAKKIASKEKQEEMELINADPVKQKEVLDDITSSHNNPSAIQSAAKQCAYYLRTGSDYPWFLAWLPEVDEAYLEVKKVSPNGNVPHELITAYAQVTAGNDLQSDAIHYFWKKDYDTLNF